jgi:C_GCAxxG_C_C family probable redox protein
MFNLPGHQHSSITQAAERIGERAANLFLTRQLWCSGAVLVVLNQVLGGDLTQEMAIRLAAGLGDGMGGSGCLCGGLNGGALALGLFLGTGRLAPGGDQKVLEATHALHNRFKAVFGSTCCRVLTKRDADDRSTSHSRACAQRTAKAAELTAALILDQRPELIEDIDWPYLNQKDGRIGARIKIVADRLLK